MAATAMVHAHAALVVVAACVLLALIPSTGAVAPVFAPFEESAASKKPLHLWDFETRDGNNKDFADHGQSNNPMRTQNDVRMYHKSCPSGKCARLTNCNQRIMSVNAYDDAKLSGSKSKSLAIWYLLEAYNGDGDAHAGIFGFGSNAGSDCSCVSFATLVTHDYSRMIGCHCDVPAAHGTPGRPIPLHQWQHIALTYDEASRSVKLYTNGMYSSTMTTTLRTRGDERRFIVGADSWWRGTAHPACYAAFDEARVYDYTLTADEVMQLYQLPKQTSPSPGGTYMPFEAASPLKMPKHYWNMENTVTGGACATGQFCYEDLVGDFHMIRLGTTHTHIDTAGACVKGECAKIDGCDSNFMSTKWFDGTFMQGRGARTVSVWANIWNPVGDGDTHVTLVSFGSSIRGNSGTCDCSAFSPLYSANGARLVGCGSCDVHYKDPTYSHVWFHLVAAYGGSGTPATLYYNGRKVAELAGADWNTRGDWRPIVFGDDTWWHANEHPACRMFIDEVKIYDYALNADEVLELYNPAQAVDASKATLAPFERDNVHLRPVHMWDMETMVSGWRCSSTQGCYADLLGGNHLMRINPASARDYTSAFAQCPVGKCAEISSCSSWFESLESVDQLFGADQAKSVALWYNLASTLGDGDSVVPLVSLGGHNVADQDCTCSSWGLSAYTSGISYIGCGCDGTPQNGLPLNEWHHAVLAYGGGSSPLTIYVDGKAIAEYSRTVHTRGAVMRFMFGRDTWHRGGLHPACKIRLDELRAYNYKLSPAQVAELYRPVVSLPSAPANIIALADNTAVRVRWDYPADDGGGAITEYTVVVSPDPGTATRKVTAPTREVLFTGLTNGVAYAFKVRATNEAGSGIYSPLTDAVTPEDGYGTHPIDGGGWKRWWWFTPGTVIDRSVESDVLGYDFGHCRRSDDYCFQRMPPGLVERDTELLAVDSAGNIYRWEFMPWLDVSHAAWRAFTAGIEQAPVNHGSAWNPTMLTGKPLTQTQDRFWYQNVRGFKSVQMDDDNHWCHTTLAMGLSMDGDKMEVGVDHLHDPNCDGNSYTSKDRGLTLYYRYKRSQWFTAIKTRVDDDTLAYDSTHWTEGVPFCEHCDDTKNALFDAYRSKKVRKLRLTMNSRSYVWEMLPADYGKYTLLDLVNGGARNLRVPSSTGAWAGTQGGYYGVGNGHEHYYCNDFAINRHDYPTCCGRARFGAPLSQEYGCGHPGTSEGIGLKEDCQPDYMNSGRLQWSTETNFYLDATLEVWAEGEECPVGQYRGDGVSASCVACPEGTYRDTAGGVGLGACTPCPAGSFGSSSGASSDTCSGPCSRGHYCPAGSVSGSASACPAGTYGATEGLGDSGCSGPCPAGHFCETGTVDYITSKCKAGHWGAEGQSVDTCSGTCEPGHFCAEGSTSPTNEVCGAGNFCPFKAGAPTPVPEGYHGIGGSSAETRSDTLPCERGFYCANGERIPCPAGTYNAALQSTVVAACKACVGGYFCPPGSTTATQTPCELVGYEPGAVFCAAGTDTITPVDDDHYSTPLTSPTNQRSGQAPCSDGYRCVNGTRYKLIDWTPASGCQGTFKASVPMAEDAAGGDQLTVLGADADYPGAPAVTFAIVEQVVPGSCSLEDPFQIDADTGRVTLKAGAELDFETCSSLDVVVKATSGDANIQCTVSAVTSDINERPSIAPTFSRTVQEASPPGTVVDGPLVASDPDAGQELSYDIVAGVGDADLDFFRVGSCTGTLSVAKAGLNHKVKNSYTLTVRVTDNGLNSLYADTVVTIDIENVNEAPVFTGEATSMFVLENSGHGTPVGTATATDNDPGDTLTYSLSKNFDNAFAINSATGAVTVKAGAGSPLLNFELKNIYSIEVTVTDDAVPPLSASRVYEIKVIDANDIPVLGDKTMSVAENSPVGTLVGAPMRAYDEDVGTTLTYEITGGNAGGAFSIDATGQLRIAKAVVDYEALAEYSLGIRVTDDGIGGSGSGTQVTHATATVQVVNVNERPVMSNAHRTVSEAAAVNTLLPPAVPATDPDNANDASFQPLTYSMTFGDSSVFAVEPLTGTVKVVGKLDFETRPRWTIGLDVTDTQLGAYAKLSASGTPDLAEGMYTDTTSGYVDASVFKNFSARIGNPLFGGQSINLFLKSTSVTGLGSGSGGTQQLQSRSVRMVCTDTVAKREGDAGDANSGWVTMRRLVAYDDGSYTLQFTAGIDTGDDYWAWRLMNLNTGAEITAGTFASDLVSGIPNAWDFRDFEVSVGSLTGGTAMALQLRGASSDGTTAGTDDGQLLYVSGVSLFAAASLSQANGMEMHSGDGWVSLATLRVPDSGKYKVLFEARITTGNDVFRWKVWRGTLVTIDVEDANEPPVLPSGQSTVVLESAAVGDYCGDVALLCSDPDAGDTTFTYAVSESATFETSGGAMLPYFTIEAATGRLMVAGTAGVTDTYPPFDYESRTSLIAKVTCTDDEGLTSDPTVVMVNVLNVNEPPVLPATTYNVVELAPAGTSLVTPLSAVDPDLHDDLYTKYRMVDGSENAACTGMFTVSSTGDITLASPAPAFGAADCTFTAEAYEDRGPDSTETSLSTTATITVQFTDKNNQPELADASATVAESAVGGDEIIALVATDLDTTPPSGTTPQVLSYRITDVRREKAGVWVSETATAYFVIGTTSGVMSINPSLTDSPLDFERVPEFRVTVVVEDDGPGRLSASAIVTVMVTDVNEAPRVTVPPMLVAENSAVGTEVSILTGSDPDADDTLTFSMAPNPTKHPGMTLAQLPFTINAANGQVKVGGAIDFETRQEYWVDFTVTDAAGLSDTAGARIAVSNVNEPATTADVSTSLSETTLPPDEVATVPATDPDTTGSTIVFAIVRGNSAARFAINGATGVITLRAGLDYEATRLYTLKVRVQDVAVDGTFEVFSTVIITITDVDDTTVAGFVESASSTSVVDTVSLETEGHAPIYIRGSNLGPVGARAAAGEKATVTATYGPASHPDKYTAQSCAVVPGGNSVIKCQSAPGYGRFMAWKVVVSDGSSSVTKFVPGTTSYAPPTVTDVTTVDGVPSPTSGNALVTVTGTNFGPTAGQDASNKVTVRYKGATLTYVPTDCVVTRAHFEIQCRTAAGVGSGQRWLVQVGGQSSSLSDATTSYASPTIASVTAPALLKTNGGETVVIEGTNFGPGQAPASGGGIGAILTPDFAVTATYEGTNGWSAYTAQCKVVEAHTTLHCATAPGVGVSHAWTVVVGGQTSLPSTELTSYGPPTVTKISGAGAVDGATVGGQRIIIDGTNFGAATPTGARLAVFGARYGHMSEEDGVRYTAADCIVTASHTQIVCLTVEGVGYGYAWEVSVGGQTSQVFLPLFPGHATDPRFRGTSYAAPIVSYFATEGGANAPKDVTSYKTSGNQWVLIHGLNLGSNSNDIDSVEYQMPGTDTPFRVDPGRCTIPEPHRLLRCPTVQGAGQNLEWRIIIARQVSRNPVTGYHRPTVTTVTDVTGANVNSLRTDGGEWITITGTGFGPVAGTQDGAPFVERVRYGRTGTEYEATDVTVLGHDTVSVKTVPGVGQNLKVIVTVATQDSLVSTATLSYALPTITAVTPATAPTLSKPATPTKVTITGDNFGLLDPFADVKIIFGNEADGTRVPGFMTPSSKTPSWEVPATVAAHTPGNPHKLTFDLPSGLGADRAVHVVVTPRSQPTEAAISMPAFFSYNAPVIEFVEVAALEFGDTADAERAAAKLGVPVTELRKLSVRGADFGPAQSTSGVDTVVREVLVEETDKDLVKVKDYSSADVYVASWTHDVVVVYTHVPYGHLKLRVTATNYTGINNEYRTLTDEQLAARAIPVESNARPYVDFSPAISALSGANGKLFNTQGGELLELTLQHLSSTNRLSIRVNNVTCPLVWLNPATGQYEDVAEENVKSKLIDSDSGVEIKSWSIKCRMPAGEGANRFVVVHRDGQRSGGSSCEDSGACIDYRAPTVGTVVVYAADGTPTYFNNPAEVATMAPTTGARMEVQGANFGLCPVITFHSLNYPDGIVKFCGDDATAGATRTHSRLEFPIPDGEGTGLDLQHGGWRIGLEVAGQRPIDLVTEQEQVLPFRYFGPIVSTVSSADGTYPTKGGKVLTVTGKYLGVFKAGQAHTFPTVWVGQPASSASSLGMHLCTDVTQLSDTQLTCMLPAGTGKGLTVEVMVADQLSAPSAASFSYDLPVVHGITLPGAPVASSRRLVGVVAADAPRPATKGGMVLRVTGSNFGSRNESHCVFATWKHAVGTPVCGSPTFDGEGELPPHLILNHTDDEIVFEMPEGMGSVKVAISIRGQLSEAVELVYADPSIDAVTPLTPDHGPTDGGTTLVISGENFGHPKFASYAVMEVVFFKDVCNAIKTQRCKDGIATGAECACSVVDHTHDSITITTPPGIGVDREVKVAVSEPPVNAQRTATTDPATFNYDPPVVELVIPNRASAQGEPSIQIRGINFGSPGAEASWSPEERVVAVDVHGVACEEADRVVRANRVVLECKLNPDVVGLKNVTITVAGQTATLPFWTETFYTRCPKDMYGQVGEVCLDCPLGSDCAGGLEEPVSQPGFFILNDTTKNFCNPARTHREYCNHVVACEPKAACTGNNECAVGYISVAPVHRCAECADRYYRRAGECVECPDNPWILIAAFLAMAICLCVSGYILNRKAVNLAFLTIGMDYFQVLALFARSRVRWPAMIKDIFHIMSVFNLNLEITAPECSIPDLGYQAKWFGIETLPLAAAGLFLICHVAILFKKRCIMGRKKRLNSHASALVAMLLVMMYVLYLFITRTVLDVFNCAPTDPPDGHEYLEVVFEPCWEAGSIQMTLLPFAILALLGYTIGYPAVVWLALWKNKFKIMEDQLLRAKGMGNTRLQNPNAYDVRKRYAKMYYQFKPDKWYWIMAILGRKFFIAFTALMFNRNPGFQLSVALLVMFCSYALQVKHTPFMSPSESEEVLRHHYRESQVVGSVHNLLANSITAVMEKGKRRGHAANTMEGARRSAVQQNAAANFFFNYNTVEATLLASAVLVNLAGVMFESNRFTDSDYYDTQRDIITIVVLLIIFASVVYFCVVFFSEVWVTFRGPAAGSKKGGKGKGSMRRLSSGKSTELPRMRMADRRRKDPFAEIDPTSPRDASAEMAASLNPMFQVANEAARKGDSGAGVGGGAANEPADVAELRRQAEAMREQLEEMSTENRTLKAVCHRLESIAGGHFSAASRNPTYGRTEFKGMRAGGEAKTKKWGSLRKAKNRGTLRSLGKKGSRSGGASPSAAGSRSPTSGSAPPPPPPPPRPTGSEANV